VERSEFLNAQPDLRQVYDYWLVRRGVATMPSRADIDPADLRKVLRNLYLIDVERAPLRFRYRLAGTTLEETLGRRLTGRYLDDGVLGELTPIALSDMTRIATEAAIILRKGALLVSEQPFVSYERLALPLAERGGEVNMILGAVFYSWFSERYRTISEARQAVQEAGGNATEEWIEDNVIVACLHA